MSKPARKPMSEIIAEKRREAEKQQQQQQQATSAAAASSSSSSSAKGGGEEGEEEEEEVDIDALEAEAFKLFLEKKQKKEGKEGKEEEGRGITVIAYDEILSKLHIAASGRYPERANRISRSMDLLRDEKLISNSDLACFRMPFDKSRQASWEELQFTMTTPEEKEGEGESSSNYQDFKNFVTKGIKIPTLSTDLHFDETSHEAALKAAGLSIDAAKGLVSSSWRNALALVRPPGHHSGEKCHGFCLVNNIAAAVANILPLLQEKNKNEENKKKKLSTRVAIIDFDVHHGDGTQKLCDMLHNNNNGKKRKEEEEEEEEDFEILFCSIHRYDNGTFFPNSGHPNEFGPRGLNFNLAFNTDRNSFPFPIICDYTFRLICNLFLIPLLRECFVPDAIFLSCGFDAAEGDPLGGQGVKNGFEFLTRQVSSTAPTFGVLEGGYDVEAVSKGVLAVVKAMLCCSKKSSQKEEVVVGVNDCSAPKLWSTAPAKWKAAKELEKKRKKKEKEEEKQQQKEKEEEEQKKEVKVENEEEEQEEPDCSLEALQLHNENWTKNTIKSLCQQYVEKFSSNNSAGETCKKIVSFFNTKVLSELEK